MVSREAVDHRDESRLDLVHKGGFVAALAESEQLAQPLRGAGGGRFAAGPLGKLSQTPADGLGIVVGTDAGQVGDDRGRGGEGGGVGLRAGLAAQDHDGRADPGPELVREPRLADAGLARDGDEHRAPGRARQAEALAQDGKLAGTADERDRAPGGAGREVDDPVRLERPLEPSRPDASSARVGDVRVRQHVGGRPDEHLADVGRRLEPRSRVDHRPGDQELACRCAAHGALAGLDPGPHLKWRLQAQGGAEPADATADRQAGPDGSQGVVFVDVRQAENGHHRVADELLGPAAQRGQLLGGGVEEAAQDLPGPLGVEALGQARRVHEVREQDGHHLAFLGLDQRADGRAAVGAVAGPLGQRQPADSARPDHQARICCTPMADQKITALGRVPLFAHCTRKELEFIARKGDEIDVPAGKTLITQDRPSDAFYVQLEGESEVKIGGRRRRVMKPGDFFGEISMIDRGPGTATVTTLTPSRLFVMSHVQFRDAIKASDALMVKVLMAMGQRLREDAASRS